MAGNGTDGDRVRLAELVAALSLGIDLGFGQPMEHVLRQCLIALRLAERIGLDEDERGGRLLHVAADQRRLPHRRARAGEMVRRRHRCEGDQVRARVPTASEPPQRRSGCSAPGNPPLHRFRLGLEFAVSGWKDMSGMIAHHAEMARVARRAARAPGRRPGRARRRLRAVGRARLAGPHRRRRRPARRAARADRRVRRGREPGRRRRGGRATWREPGRATSSIRSSRRSSATRARRSSPGSTRSSRGTP